MKTKDRIRFVVRFANKDLTKLRRGDLLNLREDLMEFLKVQQSEKLFQLGLCVGKPWKLPLPEDFSERDFQLLQLRVRDILPGPEIDHVEESKRLRGDVEYYIGWDGHRYSLELTGQVVEVFLLILLLLLVQFPLSVAGCRRRRCRNFFYRATKRQVYCSRRCANLASVKRWKERQTGVPSSDEWRNPS